MSLYARNLFGEVNRNAAQYGIKEIPVLDVNEGWGYVIARCHDSEMRLAEMDSSYRDTLVSLLVGLISEYHQAKEYVEVTI